MLTDLAADSELITTHIQPLVYRVSTPCRGGAGTTASPRGPRGRRWPQPPSARPAVCSRPRQPWPLRHTGTQLFVNKASGTQPHLLIYILRPLLRLSHQIQEIAGDPTACKAEHIYYRTLSSPEPWPASRVPSSALRMDSDHGWRGPVTRHGHGGSTPQTPTDVQGFTGRPGSG